MWCLVAGRHTKEIHAWLEVSFVKPVHTDQQQLTN